MHSCLPHQNGLTHQCYFPHKNNGLAQKIPGSLPQKNKQKKHTFSNSISALQTFQRHIFAKERHIFEKGSSSIISRYVYFYVILVNPTDSVSTKNIICQCHRLQLSLLRPSKTLYPQKLTGIKFLIMIVPCKVYNMFL